MNLALSYGYSTINANHTQNGTDFDHRTVTLWSTNGSTNIAKIQGSSRCRSAMSRLVQYSSGRVKQPPNNVHMASAKPSWQCRIMPRLKMCERDPDVVALADMLHALHTAGNAFAGEKLQHSGVSVPFNAPFWMPTN